MNRNLCLAFGCLTAFMAGGVSRADDIPSDVVAMLEKADKWEVLSLEPYTPSAAPKETFRSWEVVGKTAVTEAKAKAILLDALKEGVKEYKDAENTRRCFNPRHGIRLTHEGKTLELVICFSCEKIRAYVGGEGEKNFYVADKTAEVFNKFLNEAKVPLPKD